MRAAVLRNLSKPLSIEELVIPNLTTGQVLIKMKYSGVCGSQIKEVDGDRGNDKWLPHLLGHEGVGVVERIGPGVTKFNTGQNVGISWLTCSGADALAPKFKSLDYNDTVNAGLVTTFSEYTIVPENKIFEIPSGIDLKEAVLFGCAIPTGAGMVYNEHMPHSEDKVLVLGLGGIGLSTLIALLTLDVKDISVADISKSKLEIAKKLGIKNIYNIANIFEKKAISDYKFSLIYESTGSISGIEHAFDSLTDNGTLIFASHPPTGERISIDPHELIKGKKIFGSWGGGSNPQVIINKFAKLKMDNRVELGVFLGDTYPLSKINQALVDLKNSNSLRPIIEF